jgi:hypothetical protein
MISTECPREKFGWAHLWRLKRYKFEILGGESEHRGTYPSYQLGITRSSRSQYCSFNLVVGRKILWYFQLKVFRHTSLCRYI